MSQPTIRPLEAVRAIRRLLDDPEQTEEAFNVVRALDGGGIDRLHRRFVESEHGRYLLRERPSLLAHLADREALEALPDGTLGRAYLEFCENEGISPGGLVQASQSEMREELDEERRYIADRMRDSHDLYHLVTGCRTDLAGELGVLAFSTAQTGSIGTGFLVAAGMLHSFALPERGGPGRRLARELFGRGLRANDLPTADWEHLLTRPLHEVRVTLGITAVPIYEPYYQTARAQALAA